MLRVRNWIESPGFSSELTLVNFHLPACSAFSFFNIGPNVRHGPHHGVQKPISTGIRREVLTISCAKFCEVISLIIGLFLRGSGADIFVDERYRAFYSGWVEPFRGRLPSTCPLHDICQSNG